MNVRFSSHSVSPLLRKGSVCGVAVAVLSVLSSTLARGQCATESGGRLYGAYWGTDRPYVEVDMSNGSQNSCTSIPYAYPSTHALAYDADNEILYGAGAQRQFWPVSLGHCDVDSSEVLTTAHGLHALAWDPTTGTLYGGNNDRVLYTINPANGALTEVGVGSWPIEGMAFDSAGNLYGCNQGFSTPAFFKINVIDGTHTNQTLTNPTTGVSGMTGIAYNPNTNRFLATNNSSVLLQIRPGSNPGEWIQCPIGDNTNGAGLDALVFVNCTPDVDAVSGLGQEGLSSAVTITGAGFRSSSQVYFGEVPAPSVQFTSSTELQAMSPASLSAGWHDVQVRNLAASVCGQTNSNTHAGAWQVCVAAPTVIGLSQSCGSTAGGDVIEITGTGFKSGCTVTLGAIPATITAHPSDSSIFVMTPVNAAGDALVAIHLSSAFECGPVSSAEDVRFSYQPPPAIANVVESQVSTCGGSQIEIQGFDFYAPCEVWVGGVAAVDCQVVDTNTVLATVPPHGTGMVAVRILNCVGESDVLVDALEYVGLAPVVLDVSPFSAPYVGAGLVTLTGSNFCDGTTVTFGGVSATHVEFVSSTRLEVTPPILFPTGCEKTFEVSVVVTNPDEASTVIEGFDYFPSTERLVPSEYATIQAAIDAASDGDAILLDPTADPASESLINPSGKKLFIASLDPMQPAEVFPADSSQPTFVIDSGGRDTVIACLAIIGGAGGFRVENGARPTIVGNEVHNHGGPGILIQGGAQPLVLYNSIHTNSATQGGGIAVHGATSKVVLEGNEIFANNAVDGGGIFVESASRVRKIENNMIRDNFATGRGGGVYLGRNPDHLATRLVSGNQIYRNVASGMGGGVFIEAGSGVKLLRNELHENVSESNGGAVAVDGTGGPRTTLVIAENLIHGNSAEGPCSMGGGLYFKGNSPAQTECSSGGFDQVDSVIRDNSICDNRSQVGAGITFDVKSFSTLTRNLIAFNQAMVLCGVCASEELLCCWQAEEEDPDVIGAGILDIDSQLEFVNNTVHENRGSSRIPSDGAIHSIQGLFGSSDIRNNIFSRNDGWGIYTDGANAVSIEYNDFYMNTMGPCSGECGLLNGTNLLGFDPAFHDSTVCEGLSLRAVSPCIDAGDPATEVPIGGGHRIDMGAIEKEQLGITLPGKGQAFPQ